MRIERAATIMETFSYHYQHPFLLDSDQIVEEMSNATFESCSSFNGMSTAYPFEETKIIDCSSSVVSMDKKRKNREGSSCSLSSAQSKEIKESKIRKTKRPIRGIKDTKENKTKAEEKIEVETGYVHVRARRGQATDSHSLAERVRREKISERMKMLQGLVPGCEKVAGKALMLDEIINYVQSLQNQIEFLSMRLASMSPILYDFGLDFDILMNQQKLQRIGSMSQDQPLAVPASITKASSSQPTSFDAEITSYHPMVDTATFLPLQGQEAISFSQDSASFLMQEGNQSQGLLNQVAFNMCSFQQRQKKRTSLA